MNCRLLVSFLAIFAISFSASAQDKLWSDVSKETARSYTNSRKDTLPDNFLLIRLNSSRLTELQRQAPIKNPGVRTTVSPVQIDIPLPGGITISGSFFEAPILAKSLQQQYSGIRTYQLIDTAKKTSLGRLTITPQGISGIIFTDKGSAYISPLGKEFPDLHMVYYVKDVKTTRPVGCGVKDEDISDLKTGTSLSTTAGDCQLRTYRLAISATGEYTTWAGSQLNALGYITTTVNNVTAIYERDANITFTLVTNNSIIYTVPGSDPYPTVASPDAINTLNVNHSFTNTNIGAANYDIGLVFNNGWDGGLAYTPAACNAGVKGGGAAGLTFGTGANPTPGPQGSIFDGTVAHEMAHMFNATHTMGATNGSCGGNSSPASAWEPGGGSTLMAYTNVCTGNFYQAGSDLYFHAGNLGQMLPYAVASACPIVTSTGNSAPNVTVPAAAYTIPISTPFTLTSTATDADGNSLTYTWEQMNAGTSAAAPASTNLTGPNFRSFPPSGRSSRTFPNINSLAAGTATPYEVLASVARTMNFRVSVRDNAAGGGCTDEDNIAVTTNAGAGPFTVTSQNTPTTLTANGVNTTTITWNVANTNNAPVSCATVNILFSIDGGLTYPYTLLANTANDGTQVITVPNLVTSVGRIMVQSVNNVFFNINSAFITINSSCSAEAATITPSTNVSANAGNATLDLTLNPLYGNIVTITGQLAVTDPASSLAVNNLTAGTCINFGGNQYRYDAYQFVVNVAGNYTFTKSGPTSGNCIFNLYNGSFNPGSPCTNFMNSNGTFNGSAVGTAPFTSNLAPGIVYTMTVGTFSAAAPVLPANYTINVTPPAGGNIFDGVPNPGAGFNYTYVIVDNATGNIKAIDPSSNMSNGTTFPMGTYTIYGLSYSNAITLGTLNAYVGGPFSTLQNDALYNPGAFCSNVSKNIVAVSVLASLPVELLPLTATKVNKSVLLKWGTGSEQNTSHFDILRSSDGIGFDKVVGTVPAHGNSVGTIDYDLTDNNPEPSFNYYRVKEVDMDGKTTFGNIVSINMSQSYISASVYPSPAKSLVTLEYVTQQRGIIQVQITDSKGATVAKYQFSAQPGRNVQTFNVAKLARGVYMIQSVSSSGTVVSRFVKE